MSNIIPYQAQPLIPYSDVERMATAIAKSGLFGMKDPSQALALMLIAQAEGLHPAIAAKDYHIIQGRPALKADAMLARFQAAGGKVEWHEYTEKACSATFQHAAGGSVRVDWTIDMAKAANLTGKDVWKQYPRAMLRARVVSEGIRTVYPGVLSGMYTPEEVRDMADVAGTAETSGPTMPLIEPAITTPVYDFDEAKRKAATFNDAAKMKQWMAEERLRMDWKLGNADYEALKKICIERAEEINAAVLPAEASA